MKLFKPPEVFLCLFLCCLCLCCLCLCSRCLILSLFERRHSHSLFPRCLYVNFKFSRVTTLTEDCTSFAVITAQLNRSYYLPLPSASAYIIRSTCSSTCPSASPSASLFASASASASASAFFYLP